MDIKKKIRDAGWTISSVAEKMKNRDGSLGITQSSLSQIINGNPTLDKLQEIANIIGVSLSELVSDAPTADTLQSVCPHCGKAITVEVNVK